MNFKLPKTLCTLGVGALLFSSPVIASETITFNDYSVSDIDWKSQVDFNDVLSYELKLTDDLSLPKILLIHTYPNEQYKSIADTDDTSIMHIGTEIKTILETDYGVGVYHYTDNFDNYPEDFFIYDMYSEMKNELSQILLDNPSIEVIIDLQIDISPEPSEYLFDTEQRVGVSLVNGLSLNTETGEIGTNQYVQNKYVKSNFALSTQLATLEDSTISHIFVNQWTNGLNLLPMSLNVQFGNNEDTLDAALNTVQPFIENLAQVLDIEPQN